ncbi:hypothetical protein CORT_0G03700 [Candida orthopsilosis Co 90-125]|uniref:Pre-mRNA-splicing factor SYF2 n=1 Tax=Candida orthopsilosis (strain 90-125) TaxID=1136231 RepID=H8XA69_CANO9|nr:hypothetical protein CORT_0G03700 [Candida orthopsilosis Co 90-125]CCG25046.1 hypothetical protein CORT_0G03700 [Candida orthopsilosis Co 90-125]
MAETMISTPTETLSSLLDKFAQLKQKRQEAIKLNKADVAQETRRQKLTSLQAKSSHHHEADSRKSLSDSERVMEYTIEECEAWEERRQRKMNTGIQDQDKLAEASYYKEIKELKVDKEAYLNSKNDSDVANVDKDVKEEVSAMVKNSKDRKFNKKRGRTDDEAGNYISEKNRQFNLKLNRQYD